MNLKIREINFAKETKIVQMLFEEYQHYLGLDLCFQGFEAELKNLETIYGKPKGNILLAEVNNEIVGCVALKQLSNQVCEMKRLYLKPTYHGAGIGISLAKAIIEEAKQLGYTTMKLDTLSKLTSAISIYQYLGFINTQAYNYNPDETVIYFEKKLNETSN